MPAPKKQNITELAAELGIDRARLKKHIVSGGYQVAGKNNHNANLYRLTASEKKAVKELLSADKRQSLPLDLKEEKLKEEVEKLRLQNRKLRGEATDNTVIAGIFGSLSGWINTYLRQKLENEIPISCAGLDPADIRIKTKPLVDEIRAALKQKWEQWESDVEKSKSE